MNLIARYQENTCWINTKLFVRRVGIINLIVRYQENDQVLCELRAVMW